jgi:ATP synthase protein I
LGKQSLLKSWEPIEDDAEEEDFKRLSAEEVRALQQKMSRVSPWAVLGAQVLVGALVSLLVWMVTGLAVAAWSAAYGALAVVVPALVFLRGLKRQQNVRHAGAALGGFFVWEMVKVVLTVAMLFAAPRLILDLNWLALLAGFVVTMKVYWVAMWLHSGRKKSVAKL